MRSERVAFRVSKNMKRRLEDEAMKADKSMSDIMNDALDEYFLGGPKIEINDRVVKIENELETIKTDILELKNSLRGLIAQRET